MPARRILYTVIEKSYGVPQDGVGRPELGVDCWYDRLDKPESFEAEATPVQQPILYGGGLPIEADTVSDQAECKGKFSFYLYPGVRSRTLLQWACVPIADLPIAPNTPRAIPWLTSDANGVMPVGDLASLSFYEAILKEDGQTYRRQRYAGAKCHSWELAAADDGENRLWRLSGEFQAIKVVGNPWEVGSTDPDATEFPLPAETSYPTGPFVFSHLGSGTGTVKVGSERKTRCSALRIRGTNRMDSKYYTSRFLTLDRYLGREITAELDLEWDSNPDDRDNWRQLTALDTEFKIDNGTNTIKIDLHAKPIIRPWSQQMPNDKAFTQKLTLVARWDPAQATDMTLTFTGP